MVNYRIAIFHHFMTYRSTLFRYAMERTNDYINVWFWERGDISAPFDATSGAWTIDTNFWVRSSLHLSVRLDAHIRVDAREPPPPIFLTPSVTLHPTLMPTTLSLT